MLGFYCVCITGDNVKKYHNIKMNMLNLEWKIEV
jgi:hypothetical protein